MTCSGFPATDPATAEIPSLFGRNGTSRVERVSGGRKSTPPPQRAFHSTPSVVHMMLIHSLLVNRNDHAWAAGLCVWEAPPASAAKGAAAKRPLTRVLRLCDIWRLQRVQVSPAAAGGAAIPFLVTNKASAAKSKSIPPDHSFSGPAPSVAVHSFE
jgi:hypothetical protein